MEYGKIFSRSATIVWHNKFLIILGIIASLVNSSYSTGGARGDGSGGSFTTGDIEQLGELQNFFTGLAVGAFIGLACLALFIGLAFWAISTIARGGMIAGVDTIETSGKSGFMQAWSAGWHRGWTLLGIGFIPAVPGIILFVIGVFALGAYGGVYALFGQGISPEYGWAGVAASVGLLACVFVPIMLVLSILRNFAERACMLEGLGVIDSYKRGTKVLTANLGEAVILFLIQIAVFV
ncbi:MAG: hypothetical protein ACK2T3_17830, partial [Candidatus Promineifilaceae bacterium]